VLGSLSQLTGLTNFDRAMRCTHLFVMLYVQRVAVVNPEFLNVARNGR